MFSTIFVVLHCLFACCFSIVVDHSNFKLFFFFKLYKTKQEK